VGTASLLLIRPVAGLGSLALSLDSGTWGPGSSKLDGKLLSERAVERVIKRTAVTAIERVADEGVSEQIIVSVSDLVTLPNYTTG
jgi:hypothetical protein